MVNAKGYSSRINGVRLISDLIVVGVSVSGTVMCQNTIAITASNGLAPYEYSIDNGINWSSSSSFNNICQGQYFVVVRDKNKNRGRSMAMVYDQVDCGQYHGYTLQQVIDTGIALSNVLECTLNDFL